MSLLGLNSTPAERLAGCVFAERFDSNSNIVKNGGTITGAPVVDFGITLDGTNDYLLYSLRGDEFDSSNITIFIEFTPDFNYDDDDNYYLYATSNPKFSILKLNNASSNNLQIKASGTTIGNITTATYSSYWKQGEKNQIVLAGTSGSTQVYLNNNLILNSATAWTQTTATSLYIGCDNNTGSRFDGIVSQFKVFQSILTTEDITALYNNSFYNYIDDAVINLPMRLIDHKTTLGYSVDRSGNASDASFGAGAAEPTKLVTRGYSFDGGDGMSIPVTNPISYANDESVFFTAKWNQNEAYIYSTLDGANGGLSIYITNSGKVAGMIGATVQAESTISVVPGALFSGCILRNGGSSITYYHNGLFDNTDSSLVGVWYNFQSDTFLGCKGDGAGGFSGNYFEGNIYTLVKFDYLLSSIQIADLHFNAMRNVHAI